MNNLKFAVRQLLKNPGFTAVAVLTLALGIGATTAMFSFVNAVVLKPLPYAQPDGLVMVFENYLANGWRKNIVGPPVLDEWRRRSTVFEGLAAVRSYGNFTLTGRGSPEPLEGTFVSANLFSLLRVNPLLGRSFLPEEETVGRDQVVILSYGLWQRRFGGDANILGQTLVLGARSYTVIGVMPRHFVNPYGERELWAPLAFTPDDMSQRHNHSYTVYGRLKQGVTLAHAREEMDAVARGMAEADAQNQGWGAEVYPLKEIIVGDAPRLLFILLGAVGFVLLIGCANIASLLLARSSGRTREFAIRAALGAGRSTLIRQLLTESLLLAVIGGTLGIVVAWLGIGWLVRLSPADLPRLGEGISIDGSTLAFTTVVTLATGLIFGLFPARQATNPTLSRELTESARGSSDGRQRQFARSILVVGEVALSLMLLIASGLLLRSFARLLEQNPGYVPEQLVTTALNLPRLTYPELADRLRVLDPFLAATREIPGVQSAAYAYGVPLTKVYSNLGVTVRGAPPPAPGATVSAGYSQVSPGYFATLKIPFVEGRDFTDFDGTNSARVVIVNQQFAKDFKLGDRILGRHIDIGDGATNAEIVGVVGDLKRQSLAGEMKAEVYVPYRQKCWGYLTLAVRTQRDSADVMRAIRGELDRFDRDLPLDEVRTMTQLVSADVAERKLAVRMLGGFAGCALLLSALGLYGVLAYTVSQRTREIGIRLALGAQRREVLGLVIAHGMRLTALGVVIGLGGAFLVTRILDRLLYEIKPSDPVTFAAVSITLAVVALAACWLPARRAARVDPMVALRTE